MPTYVYRFVDTGETIEVQQAFADDALTEAAHPGTGEVRPVKKVFTPVGVSFKGGGFYKTDSRAGSGKRSTGAKADGDAGSSTSSDTSGSSDKGSKPESSKSESSKSDTSKSGPAASPSSSSTSSSSTSSD